MAEGKVALLFPGQGAQFVGMGQALADELPAARAVFDRADEALGFGLARLCFQGPEEELNSTAVSQPAIYTVSMAALEAFRANYPDEARQVGAVGGLSLGEYTALAYAGALSFEDGLRLVHARGRFMQQASEATAGGMVSILGMEEDDVRDLCRDVADAGPIDVANLNCPGQIVVSGALQACLRIAREADKQGAARAVPLTVAGAFHSVLMRPADEQLAAELARVQVRRPVVPVLANVTGGYHDGDPEGIRQRLVRQVTGSVLWESNVRQLLADGFERFYEVGPGKVLTGIMRRIDRRVPCQPV